MSWRENLLMPNHILALRFREGVVFLRILEVENQEYIFPLDGSRNTLSANTSSDPGDWSQVEYTPTITVSGQTKNLFEVDDHHKDEVVHFFFGLEPYDIFVRIRYGKDGPRRFPNMYVSAYGGLRFEYIQSDFYNPDIRTELFGFFRGPTPYIYLINPYNVALSYRIRFVGRRYKYAPIPPERALALREVKAGVFALRTIGNIDTLVTLPDIRNTFGTDPVSYEDLVRVMRG